MAGKMTAAIFEARYGAIARQEFPHCTTAYMLCKALAKRRPPVSVTDCMLKVWFQNFSRPPNAVVVSTQEHLQQVCGMYIAALAAEHGTEYSLQRALTRQCPPVYADKHLVGKWLRKHMQVERIHSAGHLELQYGAKIRELQPEPVDAAQLRIWHRGTVRVETTQNTCQTWVSSD